MSDPGKFSRGWVCQFGSVSIRHRVRAQYTGQKGSAKKLPADHPPWLCSGIPTPEGKWDRWFWSLEEAMAWAQGEIGLQRLRAME